MSTNIVALSSSSLESLELLSLLVMGSAGKGSPTMISGPSMADAMNSSSQASVGPTMADWRAVVGNMRSGMHPSLSPTVPILPIVNLNG